MLLIAYYLSMFKFWKFWEKQGRFIFVGIGVGLLILGLIFIWRDYQVNTNSVEFMPAKESKVVVHISGAVKNPGVYEFSIGREPRIKDLIAKAGGLSENADIVLVEDRLNLARRLIDGEKVVIPEKTKVLGEQNLSTINNQQLLININTATQAELETLPGIGPSFARKIIEYRENNNGFMNINELKAVSGVGEKTFEKIKDKIIL